MNNKLVDFDALTEYDSKIKELLSSLSGTTFEVIYTTTTNNDYIDLNTAKPGVYLFAGVRSNTLRYKAGNYIRALNSTREPIIFVLLKELSKAAVAERIGYILGIENSSTSSIRGELLTCGVKNNGDNYIEYESQAYNVSPETFKFLTNGAQTVSGEKTFSVIPKCSSAPSDNKHLANKKYVDDKSLSTLYSTSGLSEYSSSSTYSIGDYVVYSNAIYQCNTAISVAEDFDATHWTSKTYIDYLRDTLGIN